MAGVLFGPFVFSENDIDNLYSRNGFGYDKEILNNSHNVEDSRYFHYYLCRRPKAAEWRLRCWNY